MMRASTVLARLDLLPPVRGGPAGRAERPLEVDLDDGVPLLLGHVRQHPVAQDAGVVDHDVQVAEPLDCGVDQPLGALPGRDVVAVGDGLTAHAGDLRHDLLGRAEVATRPVDVAAEVVDDDLRALPGQAQRVLAADAAPRAGDDGHPAVAKTHVEYPLWRRGSPSCPARPPSCTCVRHPPERRAASRRPTGPATAVDYPGPRFCTCWKPNRPLMQRLPEVIEWSWGEVTLTISLSCTWSVSVQPTPQ